MKPSLAAHLWLLLLLALNPHLSFGTDRPLISFDFETNLVNQGTLGGSACFETYAPGEEPSFGPGPFGRCLDLTAASRHGGTTPTNAPSGGAVLFRDTKLDSLESFTLVLWARQNPLEQGSNARLLHKPGAWDLMAHSSGVTLSLSSDSAKVPYTLSGKTKLNLSVTWCFFAVAVTPQTVTAFVGSQRQPFVAAGEAVRQDRPAVSAGELALGNFSGIRPFNGWIDRVRVFHGALDEAALRALFEADRASAKDTILPPVTELAGRPTPDLRPPSDCPPRPFPSPRAGRARTPST